MSDLEAELQREINEQGCTAEEAAREFQEAVLLSVYYEAEGPLTIKEATKRVNALSYEDRLRAWKTYRRMKEDGHA